MFKKKKKMKTEIAAFDFASSTESESNPAEEAPPPADGGESEVSQAVEDSKVEAAADASVASPDEDTAEDHSVLAVQGEAPETIGPGKVLGVFSSQKVSRIGTGTTSRRVVQQSYFFAEELPDGRISLQPLSPVHVPSGPKEIISKEEMLETMLPEPEMYQKEVLPKLRDIQKNIARGDRYRKQGKSFSAEMEYGKALKIDVDNIRANFSIGLCYLEREDKVKANEVFERLVKLDTAFEQEHKHLFNEFGINLRKSKMLDQAVDYYSRALELTDDDENLHYNAARAYFEQNKLKETAEHLKECLRLNPSHEPALKFIDYLKKKKQHKGGPASAEPGAAAKAES
jgi:tetratricopeptide (TPR) repeat protein